MKEKILETVYQLRKEGMTYSQIKDVVPEFTDTLRKVYTGWVIEKEKKSQKLWLLSEHKKTKQRIVGVIGDLHEPFTHPNYFKFIVDTFIKWKVTDIVFIGDIVDNHAISSHPKSADADGIRAEYNKALQSLEKWKTEFPIAKFIRGNHDIRVARQAATIGIPSIFVKDIKEIWKLPDTWEIADFFDLDITNPKMIAPRYMHGMGAGGENAAKNMAKLLGRSVILGHLHAQFGVWYIDNGLNRYFGMSVGCGVDYDSYAMEYGQYALKKPILGCGIVINSKEGHAIPMGEEYL
ncbi:MAG: metallophosphoesterase [Desulfuromonadaceae bacterium]|nr:metallophosphoesterase [Desulfuromonadaceae bacterium]